MTILKTRNNQTSNLQKLTNEALETLCHSLENGKSQELVNFLNVMAKFPKYSLRNIFLISAQNPRASLVMGYKKWLEIGRQVKKGEKALRIYAPIKINDSENKKVSTDSQFKRDSQESLIFRPVPVFDISQTEGEDIAKFADVTGDPGIYLKRLKSFASDLDIEVSYTDKMDADGVSICGAILLNIELSKASEFHVLLHELAHEIIHLKEVRKSLSKKQKETEAEAVAYVVSQSIGLETGNASSDYIQLYNGDRETLKESLATIQETASKIIKAILD